MDLGLDEKNMFSPWKILKFSVLLISLNNLVSARVQYFQFVYSQLNFSFEQV